MRSEKNTDTKLSREYTSRRRLVWSIGVACLMSLIICKVLMIEQNTEPSWAQFMGKIVGETAVAMSLQLTKLLFGSEESYTLVVDAGSTGSRIHIFKFTDSKGTWPLPQPGTASETVHYVRSSLSAEFIKWYPREGLLAAARRAAMSIDPLFKKAYLEIPSTRRRKTRLVVRATAGLRFLDAEVPGVSGLILSELRKNLTSNWHFPLAFDDVRPGAVSVMTGREEGIYAWFALNWSLGRLHDKQHQETAAIADLGGASSQLVFEVPQGIVSTSISSHVEKLTVGLRRYHLSYRSNELYGLISARKKLLLKSEVLPPNTKPHDGAKVKEIHVHCYDSGNCYPVNDPVTGDSHLVCGLSNSFQDCQKIVHGTMFDKSSCSSHNQNTSSIDDTSLLSKSELKLYRSIDGSRCSFIGIENNQELMILRSTDIYATSFYFDNFAKVHTGPLEQTSHKHPSNSTIQTHIDKDAFSYKFSLSSIADAATDACRSSSHIEGLSPDTIIYDKMINQCFDLTYMHSLLENGYGISDEQDLISIKLIDGLEIGWPLGMALFSFIGASIPQQATPA